MAVAISAGSTTYAIAQRLADVVGLTVVTNAVRIADVLHDTGLKGQTIILTGGMRTPSDALVGRSRSRPCGWSTSTSSSWASTAWTCVPASPRRTSWRRRRTAR